MRKTINTIVIVLMLAASLFGQSDYKSRDEGIRQNKNFIDNFKSVGEGEGIAYFVNTTDVKMSKTGVKFYGAAVIARLKIIQFTLFEANCSEKTVAFLENFNIIAGGRYTPVVKEKDDSFRKVPEESVIGEAVAAVCGVSI